MNDTQPFISGIVSLWNIHQQRENVYRQVMTIENLGTFRRLCSQGYTTSLLFKKEIQWLYDEVKCALFDGDIRNFTKTENITSFNLPSEYRPSIARILQDQEFIAIKQYKRLLQQKNITQDAKYILADHLEKLNDISFNLNKQLTKSSPKYSSQLNAILPPY